MNKHMMKVLVAVLLAGSVGGGIYWAYLPRLTCPTPAVVRDAIAITNNQTVFEYTYTVRNPSLQTIAVDGVKGSCNCLRVDYDRVIPPRGTGQVKAFFKVVRNMVGRRLADFVIFANQRPTPLLRLQMTYSFELGMWMYPEQIDLGRVVMGQPVTFTLNVRQEGMEGRTRKDVVSVTGEGIAFEVMPFDATPAGKDVPAGEGILVNQRVVGTLTNTTTKGYHHREVRIQTSHPDYPTLIVPVRWESVSNLNFTPSTVHFGFMEAGAKAQRSITLIAESGEVQVLQAAVSGDGFRLESQRQVFTNRVAFAVEAKVGVAGRNAMECAGNEQEMAGLLSGDATRTSALPGVRKGKLKVELVTGETCEAGLLFVVE